MLLLMAILKRVLIVLPLILFVLLLGGCGNTTLTPVVIATLTPGITSPIPSVTPSPTSTTIPSPTNTLTATSEPDISPGCTIVDEKGKLYILSNDEFFALGPKEEELNRALENNFPEWANYEQNVRWDSEPAKLGEIVREASFQEQFALNPAVTLVTLGESLDWQLPSDSDLFLQSMTIGERLNYLWFEWANPENENIRVQNPEVSNGATYALYVFFDHDKDRLQAWQDTYYRLFGEYPSQPPTSTLLQSSATTVEPFLARPFYNPDNSFFTVTLAGAFSTWICAGDKGSVSPSVSRLSFNGARLLSMLEPFSIAMAIRSILAGL